MSVQGGDLRVGEREGDKEFSKETQAASFLGWLFWEEKISLNNLNCSSNMSLVFTYNNRNATDAVKCVCYWRNFCKSLKRVASIYNCF